MDSFFARNRLSAYLDGELPEPEASEVAAAIERDPDLKAEYENLRRSINLLRKAGPVKAPPGFHARIIEQIRDEPHPGGVVVRLQRVLQRVPIEAMALAAAAAVVVMVIQARTDRSLSDHRGEEVASSETQGTTAQSSDTKVGSRLVASEDGIDSARAGSIGDPPSSADGDSSASETTYLALTSRDNDILLAMATLIGTLGSDSQFLSIDKTSGTVQPLQANAMAADTYEFQRVILSIPTEKMKLFRAGIDRMDAELDDTALGAPYIDVAPSATHSVIVLDVTYLPPM